MINRDLMIIIIVFINFFFIENMIFRTFNWTWLMHLPILIMLLLIYV